MQKANFYFFLSDAAECNEITNSRVTDSMSKGPLAFHEKLAIIKPPKTFYQYYRTHQTTLQLCLTS